MRRKTISAIRFGYGLGPDGARIALPHRLLQSSWVDLMTLKKNPAQGRMIFGLVVLRE